MKMKTKLTKILAYIVLLSVFPVLVSGLAFFIYGKGFLPHLIAGYAIELVIFLLYVIATKCIDIIDI